MNSNGLLTVSKKKTILSICLFIAIFGGLLAIASIFDLDISRLLTKNSLPEGEYISVNGFALFFEAVGCNAFYIMIAIAGAIAFWYGFASDNGKKKIVYMIIGAVIAVVAFFLLFKDAYSYVSEYIGARLSMDHGSNIGKASELAGSMYVKLICVVGSLFTTLLLFGTWKNVSKEHNEVLIKWAYMIVCVVACVLIIELIKNPVGRVRYRTMNYLGNFDLYTPWYQANGKRKLYDLVGADPTKPQYNFVSDACKSFPSGHTFSAGLIYTLLALPYLLPSCNKKGVRAALWCGTVAVVGTVALSRIVAGAHFMSDVLMGGTIAFLSAMIMREIFICKGAHFKVFAKAKEAGEETEEEIAEAVAEEVVEESVEEKAEVSVEEQESEKEAKEVEE